MAGGQSGANRAGVARQGGEGKQEVGGHHRFQQEQTPGAKAAPVPGGRQALGRSVCPAQQQRPARLSPDKNCPQRSHHGCPRARPKENGGDSRPSWRVLHCLRPRQLCPWNLPQETPRPGDVSCTCPTASRLCFCSSHLRPEPKRRGGPAQTAPRALLPSLPKTRKEKL